MEHAGMSVENRRCVPVTITLNKN